MFIKIVLLFGISAISSADKDDKKWVWNGSSRSSNSEARSYDTRLPSQKSQNRYNLDDPDYRPFPIANGNYFPTNLPNQGPTFASQRPTPVYENRPPVAGVGFLPGDRPGGVYGNVNRPTYGGAAPYSPEGDNPGILTGPIPSWIKDGPIKNFDKCKCTEKFNCNSPGISYGHCDVGKQYCCYSSKKEPGGPLPSKPVHSLENGVLVGPGGPIDPTPGVNGFSRPPKQLGGGFYRPGGFQGPQGTFGGNYNPGGFGGIRGEPNEYSPANGVLVGPGGPFDGPGPVFAQGRSAKPDVKIVNKS